MVRVLQIFLIFCSIAAMCSCSLAGNKIAVIPLEGAIQSSPNESIFGGSAITPDGVRKQLNRVKNDVMVKAIVLQVNSPGGDVGACEEIAYELDSIEVPIVVSMRSIAASGGYYISAKADKIVALQSTLTGSIGVISIMPNWTGLLDKVGVKMEVIKSGEYKDMHSGFSALTVEEREIMQKTNDRLYDQFIEVVSEGRSLDQSTVKTIATGQIYTGMEARALGLVDEIGGTQTAIDIAAKLANIQDPVIEYVRPESPSLFNMLLSGDFEQIALAVSGKLSDHENIIASGLLSNVYPKYLYR